MDATKFWPYDEVKLTFGSQAAEVLIESPWISMTTRVEAPDVERAGRLVGKFRDNAVSPADLDDLNWFFGALSAYPVSYLLPRPLWQDGLDTHTVGADAALPFAPIGTWDVESALAFAATPQGIDPVACFSVARRFHLLDSVESNRTEELYAYVKELRADPERFKRAGALMVRQNHYVTHLCNASLAPALAKAQSARGKVQDFMNEEFGHDRILDVALRTITPNGSDVPVTAEVEELMRLLRFAAERNFLAFAMVVDFFERSSYRESDPLASVLQEGGLNAAARQINRHMNINDAGGHENVALGFLAHMGPVDAAYATEALHIAEKTTAVMNAIATGVMRILRDEQA